MSNTERIAKNTVFLYLRSLIVMVIALYTSRVILRVLGVEDYGIYSVVGGVITMLTTLTSTMQATYQRYFNVEMGRGKPDGVARMFQLSLSSQLFIAAIVVLFAETIGLWIVANKLVIPEARITAAIWVYQASVIKFVLAIFTAPFGSLIIAYERMGIFAVISILDSILQLAIVFLIQFLPGDNLIIYAYLQVLVSLINIVLYTCYCKSKFEAAIIRFRFEKELRSLFSFSGWSLLGELGYVAKTQGIDIVLNLFFGPVINAARGVASQVLKAVNQFTSSFQTSFRPQLTTSYSSGDFEYMRTLYYSATKLSYYLIFTLSLPLLLETPYILHLWLGENVPDYTAIFTRLVLLTAFVGVFSNPTSGIAYATGKIKLFSIVVGVGNVLILPIAWAVLKLGYGPASTMWVSLIMSILIQVARVIVTSKVAPVSVVAYVNKVVIPTSLYSIMCLPVPFVIVKIMNPGFVRLLLTCCISVGLSLLFAWIVGLNHFEKQFIRSKVNVIIGKITKIG